MEKYTVLDVPQEQWIIYPWGPQPAQVASWVPWTYLVYRSRQDTIRRKRPALPLLNPTSHSATRCLRDSGTAHTIRRSRWVSDTWNVRGPSFRARSEKDHGSFGLDGFFNTTSVRSQTDLMAILRNKALLAVSDRKLDVATSLAEAKTTVAYLGSRTQSLARMLHAVKKGRLGDLKREINNTPVGPKPRWVKDIARYKARPPLPERPLPKKFGGDTANRYLEVKYGILPTLYDVVDAAEALADYIHSKPPELLMEQRVKHKTLITADHEQRMEVTSDQEVYGLFEIIAKWQGVINLNYWIDLEHLKRAAEMGIISPSVVWEVVPYSFVVDMVLPVGDFIEACGATLGCRFHSGWELERVDAMSTQVDVRTSGLWSVKDWSPAFCHSRGFVRRSLYSFPAPQFYVKNPMSWSNAATVSALLRQLV